MGSSVAYKTRGTFLSQNKRHEDACGWATEMQSSGSEAVYQWPTLSFTHWTCKFDLTSEFIAPPPPHHQAVTPEGSTLARALYRPHEGKKSAFRKQSGAEGVCW